VSTQRKTGKGAPSGTSGIEEIELARCAHKYGEVEPLLRHFVEHGLRDQYARKLVARLARGKSLRASGNPRSPEIDQRDEEIRMLVAYESGVLASAGRDPRRAFGIVAKRTQQGGNGLSAKQVKRIWDARESSGTLRTVFDTGRMIGHTKRLDANSRD